MRTLGNEAGRSEERAARPTCAQVFLFVLVYAMVCAQRVCVPVPFCVVVPCGEKANVCMCVLARGKTADANRVLSPSSLSLLLAQPQHCPLNKYYRTESAHAFFAARELTRRTVRRLPSPF